MDKTTYSLCKKLAAGAVSGVDSMSVEGLTLTINCKDGTVLKMTFPTPADGVSITDVEINASNHLICTLSDGNTEDAGEIKTVKGAKGDKGDKGDPGQGIAPGGSAGQMLVKNSDSDYDVKWVTPPGGTVIDTEMSLSSENPVQNKVVTAAIGDKVDKVSGKGLSTNDYSDADKAIVDGVGTALDGKVDKVNGKGLSTNDYDDTEKAKVAAAITKAVDDLVNYYTKSQTYTKTEVDNIAAAIRNSRFEVVSVLPTTDIQTNVIYLVPKSTAQTNNIKDEYINLDGTTAGWEKIGDTEIDLSGYVTTTALNTALADYTTTTDLTALLAGKTNLTVISPAFVATRDYAVNSYVTHDGKLYKCTTAHPAGDWDANDFTEITVVGAKADKVSGATSGHFAGLNGNGNLTDSGKSASDFGTADEIADIVNVYGTKNLIPYPFWSNNQASPLYGVSYTINADGSITFSGTSTQVIWFGLCGRINYEYPLSLKAGNYIISCAGLPSDVSSYVGIFEEGNTAPLARATYTDPEGLLELETDKDVFVGFRIPIDFAIDTTIKPMLRMASIKDDTFVPYAKTNRELTVDKAEQSEVNDIVNVYGSKNLNRYPYYQTTKTQNGITFTDNGDGTITVNGTATANADFLCHFRTNADLNDLVIPNGTYILTGCPSGGATSSYALGANRTHNGSAETLGRDIGNGAQIVLNGDDYSADEVNLGIFIEVKSGTTVSNLTFRPMLRLASIEDDTYVPYAPTNAKLNEEKMSYADNGMLGAKNLVPYPHYQSTRTMNGITFTDNGDGSVTVNGTATAQAGHVIIQEKVFPNGTRLAFNGCPSGGSLTTYWLRLERNPNPAEHKADDYGEGAELTVQDNETLRFLIIIANGVTCNNLVFRPMIRLASDPDDTYQPYAKTNLQLTNEGPIVKAIPVEWNEDLNLGSNKGGSILQYGKLYFVTYWFKATTATTGNVGIVKLPKNGLTGGNYVITEGDDTAVWGGKATIDGVDYVSISCPMVVDKVYRAQCVWIDNS